MSEAFSRFSFFKSILSSLFGSIVCRQLMLLYLTLNLPTDFSNLAITHDTAESYQRSPCRKIRKKRQKFVFDLGKSKMELRLKTANIVFS